MSFSLESHFKEMVALTADRWQLETKIPSSDDNSSLTLKMTTAQVVETSATNNSLCKESLHPDDHYKQVTDTPGFKPFTMFCGYQIRWVFDHVLVDFGEHRNNLDYVYTGARVSGFINVSGFITFRQFGFYPLTLQWWIQTNACTVIKHFVYMYVLWKNTAAKKSKNWFKFHTK